MDPAVTALWSLLAEGGPTFIAAFSVLMWWLERKDRLRLQMERDALLERVVTAQLTVAQSMQDVRDLIARMPVTSRRNQ